MGGLINFVQIFVLIIGGLFAATYLRRVIGEENISPRYGIFGGDISRSLFLLVNIWINVQTFRNRVDREIFNYSSLYIYAFNYFWRFIFYFYLFNDSAL